MPQRKFTAQQRMDIVRRYNAGEKVAAIAAAYGCAESYPSILAARAGVPQRMETAKRRNMAMAAYSRKKRSGTC